MATFVEWLNGLMTEHIGLGSKLANLLDESIAIILLVAFCVGINWMLQSVFRSISSHSIIMKQNRWNQMLIRRRLGYNILLLLPGILFYVLSGVLLGENTSLIRLLHRLGIIYLIIVSIRICNSILLSFLDAYSKSDRYRTHPLKGMVQAMQVVLYFVGGIIIVAVLIDKSPAVLLTGLGASAAVLMLIFKDSILGFVAGVQLSQNNMVRIGDWIQMPDGSANGTVEEITLNSVKVRNWDNTLSMIPPYTLVSTTFKNWRGMQESGGRRADKCLFIDINSLEICSPDFLSDLRKGFPILKDYFNSLIVPDPSGADRPDRSTGTYRQVTNIEIYRAYIEAYLRKHPDINSSLDLIVTQKEATAYGLPIEVYFFVRDKVWDIYERKQSDIFDHLMAIAPEFGLHLYQRP